MIELPVTAEHVKSAMKLAHLINSLERLDLITDYDEAWMMQAIVAIKLSHLTQKCEAIADAMKEARLVSHYKTPPIPQTRRR